MKVSETMTRDVKLAAPQQSICEAAQLMADMDIGSLPVSEADRLVGMITDRDIAVRAVAAGRGPNTLIREIMSKEVLYCYEDQDIEEVTQNMGDVQVRRLPVLNRDKRLVGIVTLADIAGDRQAQAEAGMALAGISQRGGEHSQSGPR